MLSLNSSNINPEKRLQFGINKENKGVLCIGDKAHHVSIEAKKQLGCLDRKVNYVYVEAGNGLDEGVYVDKNKLKNLFKLTNEDLSDIHTDTLFQGVSQAEDSLVKDFIAVLSTSFKLNKAEIITYIATIPIEIFVGTPPILRKGYEWLKNNREKKFEKIASQLIERGLSINSFDLKNDKHKEIFGSLIHFQPEIVRKLIETAEPNIATSQCQSLLKALLSDKSLLPSSYLVFLFKHSPRTIDLVKTDEKGVSIWSSSSFADLDSEALDCLVKYAIKTDQIANIPPHELIKALNAAVKNDSVELVEMILKANPNIDLTIKDSKKYTPLMHCKSSKMLELLMKHAAEHKQVLNPNEPDPNGNLPLGEAIDRNDVESVNLLLSLKADVNALSKGQTPINMLTRYFGHTSDLNKKIVILQKLLDAGAKITDATSLLMNALDVSYEPKSEQHSLRNTILRLLVPHYFPDSSAKQKSYHEALTNWFLTNVHAPRISDDPIVISDQSLGEFRSILEQHEHLDQCLNLIPSLNRYSFAKRIGATLKPEECAHNLRAMRVQGYSDMMVERLAVELFASLDPKECNNCLKAMSIPGDSDDLIERIAEDLGLRGSLDMKGATRIVTIEEQQTTVPEGIKVRSLILMLFASLMAQDKPIIFDNHEVSKESLLKNILVMVKRITGFPTATNGETFIHEMKGLAEELPSIEDRQVFVKMCDEFTKNHPEYIEEIIGARKGEKFEATPEGGAELQKWYTAVELRLKHIVHELSKETTSIPKRDKSILEIAEAAGHCGTRWWETPLEVEQDFNKDVIKVVTLEDKFLRLLQNFRLGIIEELSKLSEHEGPNVHYFNRYMFLIGKEMGIPGFDQITLDTSFAPELLEKETAIQKFKERYTLPNVIKFFSQEFEKTPAAIPLTELLEWLRNNIPESFEKTKYEALRNAAKMLDVPPSKEKQNAEKAAKIEKAQETLGEASIEPQEELALSTIFDNAQKVTIVGKQPAGKMIDWGRKKFQEVMEKADVIKDKEGAIASWKAAIQLYNDLHEDKLPDISDASLPLADLLNLNKASLLRAWGYQQLVETKNMVVGMLPFQEFLKQAKNRSTKEVLAEIQTLISPDKLKIPGYLKDKVLTQNELEEVIKDKVNRNKVQLALGKKQLAGAAAVNIGEEIEKLDQETADYFRQIELSLPRKKTNWQEAVEAHRKDAYANAMLNDDGKTLKKEAIYQLAAAFKIITPGPLLMG